MALWFQKTFSLPAQGKGIFLLTDHFLRQIEPEIRQIRIGIAHFFLQHTSAALCLNENCLPEVRQDMQAILDRLVPPSRSYRHNDEGPDDMPGHAKCAIVGPSLTIPIKDGRLAFGTWQGIYFLEFRPERAGLREKFRAQSERTVVATLNGTA